MPDHCHAIALTTAPAIALALGGSAVRSSDGWCRAPCPAHGGTGNSLAVRTNGSRIYVHCFSQNCSRDAILLAIDHRLGTRFSCPVLNINILGPRPEYLDGSTPADTADDSGLAPGAVTNIASLPAEPQAPPDIAPQPTTSWWKPIATPARAVAAQERENTPAQVRERLDRIFRHTQPVTPDDPVHRYLTETRGLALPVIPRTLRYHPRLYHGPTETFLPAMVALVMDHAGKPVAIHRTWLNALTADKAFSQDSRMVLGPCRGSAVHLAGNEDSKQLLIGEGIETTLAAAQLAAVGPGVAVWACLSTSGMKTLIVPHRFRRVVIAADHDLNGAGA
jgi:hypothetical protein